MVGEEQRKTPRNQKKASKAAENGGMSGVMISPSFKSAAALAGWDEEALLFASLVVQDTPERTFKHPNTNTNNTPSHLNLTTPPTNSRRYFSTSLLLLFQSCYSVFLSCVCAFSRKRRAQRGALSVSATVLDLHQLDTPTKGHHHHYYLVCVLFFGCCSIYVLLVIYSKESCLCTGSVKRRKGDRASANEAGAENKEICDSSSSGSALPCLEKLREELTCAVRLLISYKELVFISNSQSFFTILTWGYFILVLQICLEMCFEPSTTPCGHRYTSNTILFICSRRKKILLNGLFCIMNVSQKKVEVFYWVIHS